MSLCIRPYLTRHPCGICTLLPIRAAFVLRITERHCVSGFCGSVRISSAETLHSIARYSTKALHGIPVVQKSIVSLRPSARPITLPIVCCLSLAMLPTYVAYRFEIAHRPYSEICRTQPQTKSPRPLDHSRLAISHPDSRPPHVLLELDDLPPGLCFPRLISIAEERRLSVRRPFFGFHRDLGVGRPGMSRR
jgi:hypothetical protein